MTTCDPNLEALFDKVRALPPERRQFAIDALTEIADVPYRLTTGERAILVPAVERMCKGEFADEQAVDELLNEPWR